MADSDQGEPSPAAPLTYSAPHGGLKPAAFTTGKWPKGRSQVPAALLEGLTDNQAALELRVIDHIRNVALNLHQHVTAETTESAFADRLGVSRNRLRAFRTGVAWPDAYLMEKIRLVVPSYYALGETGEPAPPPR